MKIIILLLVICFCLCCDPKEKLREYQNSVQLFTNLQQRALLENDEILYEHLYFAIPKVKKLYYEFMNCTISTYQDWLKSFQLSV